MSNTKTIMGQASNQYVAPTDITDVFSTYLYTGTGAARTITNGIDLAGEGGLVWQKSRENGDDHRLSDTERGVNKTIRTNNTGAEFDITGSNSVSQFNSNGFESGLSDAFFNGEDIASWTFRKAPKFFDCITWTGDGTGTRAISHTLDTTVGMLLVKRTSDTEDWTGYHRGVNGGVTPQNYKILINSTAAAASSAHWASTAPTTTTFTVSQYHNVSGATYVAYLFAHNNSDGTFGPDGDQDIIKCGSYTGDGSTNGPEIDLGFEPQFIITKRTDGTGNWLMFDAMRGIATGGNDAILSPNQTWDETVTTGDYIDLQSTGFKLTNVSSTVNESSATYIYMAIRRGPLAPPTAGTEVFETVQDLTSIANRINGTIGPVDFTMQTQVPSPLSGYHFSVFDRLRGLKYLQTSATDAEGTGAVSFDTSVGVRNGAWFNSGGLVYNLRRAPSFFDVVAYSGTAAVRTVSHNLGVAPEMMWVKGRTTPDSWAVWHKDLGVNQYLQLNQGYAVGTNVNFFTSTNPTKSVFSLGGDGSVNGSGDTYISYLFASLAGVSKVGSYSGDSSASVNVDCGFTSGARFVLIKNSTSTGDWWVIDTVRGLTSSNDALIRLNSTAAEVTSVSRIDPYSSGFTVTNSDDPEFNRTGNTYIFYAIA